MILKRRRVHFFKRVLSGYDLKFNDVAAVSSDFTCNCDRFVRKEDYFPPIFMIWKENHH